MRKMVLLLASMALAVLLATGAGLFGLNKPAQAAFPGQNGRITLDRGHGLPIPGDLRDIAWSPTGNRVAYATVPKGQSDTEIVLSERDGSWKRQLTNNAAQESDPSWSPDSSKIAFLSNRSGGTQIYKMDTDRTNVVELTNGAGGASSPVWSPKGDKIAFVRDGLIHTMEPAPENENTNKPVPLLEGNNPDWSPDGEKLVFSAWKYTYYPPEGPDDAPDCDYESTINTVRADGTEKTTVVREYLYDYGCGGVDDVAYVAAPVWSPDGSKVAYFHHVLAGNVRNYVKITDLSSAETTTGNGGLYARSLSDWQPLTDATHPGTYLTSYPPHGWNPPRAAFKFASTDSGTTLQCSLDGGPYRVCASPKAYTGLSHGTHVFRVRARDAAGKVDPTPATHKWRVDRKAPLIYDLNPSPGASTKDRTPDIRAYVKDFAAGMGHLRFFKDGKETNQFAYNFDTKRLVYLHTAGREFSFGWHTVKVVARDQVGNVATRSWSFKVVR